MSKSKTLKSTHLFGTVWFMLCIGYVLVLTLRQAGVHWWIIFSLSGHSMLLIFMLISLYLFAIFRGITRNQKIEIEHPLTSTSYYMMLYVITPFLGGLAGVLGMIGENRLAQFLLGIALGTLGAGFLVWVIIDPVVGFMEMLLPESRKHSVQRLTHLRALRQRQQEKRQNLLDKILAQGKQDRLHWQQILKPQAEKLAGLLTVDKNGYQQAGCEAEAIDIGVKAWQTGGLGCMQQLRNMTMDLCKGKSEDLTVIDYITTWWDGIGTWRNSSLSS